LIRFADGAAASLSEQGAPSTANITSLTAAVAAQLLKLEPPDPNRAIRLLEAIRAIPQITDGEGRLLALRLEAKIRAGDVDTVVMLIASLPAGQMAARHVAEACLRIVDELEARAGDLAGRGEDAEAKRINLQVARILEAALGQAGSSKDSAVLRLHLADTLVRLGRYEEAVKHYTDVMDNSPEHAGTATRGLAIAHEHSGEYDKALPWWQTLYARMKTRTSGWLEASYHCILCQLRTGQSRDAGKRMAYFRLESEGVDLGQWTSKFEALENECSKANPSSGS
jgi:tetratricopeptide (TPR) repeat protein